MNPVHFALQYSQVTSLQVVSHFDYFSILIVAFVGTLASSIVLSKSDLIRVISLVVLGEFFLGYWSIVAPLGIASDEFTNMGISNYVIHGGLLTSRSYSTNYLDYPLLHILGAQVTLISGAPLLYSVRFLVVILTAVLILTFYGFLRTVLPQKQSGLATILAVVGSLVWVHFQVYAPILIGYVLLFTLLISITRGKSLVVPLLFAGTVIAYLPASLLFLLVLLAILLLRRPSDMLGVNHVKMATAYCGTIFVGWNLYWALNTSSGLVNAVATFFGAPVLDWISQVAGIVANVPRWVSAVEYFWFGLFVVVGYFSALFLLSRHGSLAQGERILLAGAIGTFVLGTVSLLGAGGLQYDRLLYYSPIFMPALILALLSRVIGTRTLAVLTILVITALAAPTFYVQARSISTAPIYEYEYSMGQFIGTHTPLGQAPILTDQTTAGILTFFLPQVTITTYPFQPNGLAQVMDGRSQGIVVVSAKAALYLHILFGNASLSEGAMDFSKLNLQSLVFDSGSGQVFVLH